MVKSAEVAVVVEEGLPPAPAYERVHYIGHGELIGSRENLEEKLQQEAGNIVKRLEEKTGYRVYLVDIQLKKRALWTDVDFIFDVPYTPESPITAAVILTFLKYLIAALAALGFLLLIVWLFWTTYIEKGKIYYCDQCPDQPSFQGYKDYLAHLKAVHPEKYEAAAEDPWWEKILGLAKYIPWVVGGAIIVSVVGLISKFVPRR